MAIAACASIDGFLAGMNAASGPDSVPIEERPLQDPIDGNAFTLSSAQQTVIGEPQIVFAGADDTFSDLARTYGLGYDDLVGANPDVDPVSSSVSPRASIHAERIAGNPRRTSIRASGSVYGPLVS